MDTRKNIVVNRDSLKQACKFMKKNFLNSNFCLNAQNFS